jgi:hypothetical protein
MTDADLEVAEQVADFGRALAVIDYLLNGDDHARLVVRRIGYDLLAKYPKPEARP